MTGSLRDDPLSVTHSEATYCYHKDSLGTVTDMTDSTGTIVQSYQYDSFGNIIGTTGSITQPFVFTGREFDSETGLYYYRERYYDAKTGEFISKDPLAFNGGINNYNYVDSVGKPLTETNPYMYTGNNPVNRIDPMGLTWLEYIPTSGTLYVHPGTADTQGPPSASFFATNNAATGSRGDWAPGTYDFLYWVPHTGGSDGRFGSNGNFVFDVPGCQGYGIHSGHSNSCDKASRCGAAHATNGCIRTTDNATLYLRNIYRQKSDPIYFLIVRPGGY